MTTDPQPPNATEARPRKRRWVRRAIVVFLVAVAAVWAVTALIRGPQEEEPGVARTSARIANPAVEIRVLTMNLAHGRGQAFHQMLVAADAVRANLDRAAVLAVDERADVVALQEADGPSWWSGSFDHIARFVDRGAMASSIRGAHVSGLGLSYGTALASSYELTDPLSVTFAPSPPTPPKGFVVAAISLARRDGTSAPVDVASVHLDFARQSVRRRQVATLVEHLASRARPLIVCGDLNADWTLEDSPVRQLAGALRLSAHEPESGAPTFPSSGRRLDWILISAELELIEQRTLEGAGISDHRPVLAVIRWR